MTIPQDVQEFLDEYPDIHDDISSTANLQFYSNTLRCHPDKRTVDEIHDQWYGDYDKLEYKHGYIQWLFPIREHGVNYQAQPLQLHEISSMKSDPMIMERLLVSYKLMLDFYGMRLVSPESGLIGRSLAPRSFQSCYRNLVRSSHNNLRISRILKCLSELGLEYFNVGFILHVLQEQSESNELNTQGIRSSMDRWWANCIRNEHERRWVQDQIKLVRSGTVTFTRQMYEDALASKLKTGKLNL